MQGIPPRSKSSRSPLFVTAFAALATLSLVSAEPTAYTEQGPPGQAAPAGTPTAGRGATVAPLDQSDHDGWTSLFDGRTLAGWDGNPAVWKVENGAMVAASTAERRVGTTFLIWQGGDLTDFELKLEIKLDGDIHSGVTYRGRIGAPPPAATGQARAVAGGATRATGSGAAGAAGQGLAATAPPQVPSDPRWMMSGLGMDYDATTQAAGNAESRGGGRRLGLRGSVVKGEAGKPPRIIGSLGDPDALLKLITPSEWTQVHIVVRGTQFMHIINGHVMAIAIEDDPTLFVEKGTIGFQIEGYGLGQVNVRNVWLKRP